MNDNAKANTSAVFLRRALDLAAAGQGTIFKGPWLGWVLENNGIIVAEGERKCTLLDLRKSSVPENSTLFLSINPFATPQKLASWCTGLSLRACHAATASESPIQPEALELNRRFITWQQQKRPYLLLKWAETADGFIAPAHTDPYWISNAHARRLAHQWRSQEAAIWVGKTTCLRDNPRLNVRFWSGSNPLRIVIDPQLQLSRQLALFDQSQPTLCYNTQEERTDQNLSFVKIPKDQSSWRDRVRFVLDDLHARQVQSVLVEGGATLLSFLIAQGWWDEARVFRAPITFGKGISAPLISNSYSQAQQRVGDNTLMIYRRS